MSHLRIGLLILFALLAVGFTRTIPGTGITPNSAYDSNGDGIVDSILVGDYDGDGKLETIDDIQGAVLALNAAAGSSVQKHIKVVAGHFYASTTGDANSDICDATCLALLEIPPTSVRRGMVTLDSNTHLEGSGIGLTIIQGFQMAGTPGAITGFPMAGSGHFHGILSNLDHASGNTNIEISELTIDGGFTWYCAAATGQCSSADGNPQVRGMDLRRVTDSRIHHVRGQNLSHASFYVEDAARVTFANNETYRDGGFLDQSNTSNQASFYVYVCDLATDCDETGTALMLSEDIIFTDNVVLESGGNAFNLRNEFAATGSIIRNIYMHGNKINGAEGCIQVRGITNSQMYDTYCENTYFMLNFGVTTSFSDPDGSTGIVVDGMVGVGMRSSAAAGALNVPQYAQGFTFRNIRIEDAAFDGLDITAPIRNMVFENIEILRPGYIGVDLNGNFGGQNNERLIMNNIITRDPARANLGLDATAYSALLVDGVHDGTEITNLQASGGMSFTVDFIAGSTFTDSNLSNWTVEGSPPGFLGSGTQDALIDPDNGTYKCIHNIRGATAVITNSADTSSCDAEGGGGANGCTCQSILIATDLGADNALGGTGGDADIAGVTQADPGVVHTTGLHYLDVGDEVCFENVGGMVELNNNCYFVGSLPTTSSFTLLATSGGANVDTTAFTAYSCDVEWFQGTATCESGYANAWTDANGNYVLSSPVIIRSTAGWNRTEANNWRLSNGRGGTWDAVYFASAGSASAFNDVSWNGLRYREDAEAIMATDWVMNFDDVGTNGDKMLTVQTSNAICDSSPGSGCVNYGANTTGRNINRTSFNICGEATTVNNNTVYYGPSISLLANTSGGQTCDINAVGNVTEATADAPIYTSQAFKVNGMTCRNEADANAAISYTLRTAAGATVPSVTCSIADNNRDCVSTVATQTNIAAGATVAIAVASTSDIADANGFVCEVFVEY